jgi:cell division protein FtsB
VLIALTLISTTALVAFHHQSQSYQQRINQTTKQLEDEKAKQRTELEQKMHELQQQNDAKQKQIDDLNGQLQAKAASRNVLASATRAVVSYVAPTAYASSPNDDKAFIYARESGNNPGAVNASSGACGLGQALPCSKMPCSLSDYACQDQFFTNYMLGRYGSWSAAKAFWLNHSWW